MKTGILLPDYSARTLIQYTQGKQENDKNLNSVFNGFSKQTLNMLTGTAAYKSWPFEGKKQIKTLLPLVIHKVPEFDSSFAEKELSKRRGWCRVCWQHGEPGNRVAEGLDGSSQTRSGTLLYTTASHRNRSTNNKNPAKNSFGFTRRWY